MLNLGLPSLRVALLVVIFSSPYLCSFISGQDGLATPPKFLGHNPIVEITDSEEHLLSQSHRLPTPLIPWHTECSPLVVK